MDASDTKPGWSERWGPARNQRRQRRYKDDETYRQKRVAQSRESYRSAQGVELFSCLSRIPRAEEFCRKRATKFDGDDKVYDRLCFTMGEFAAILGDYTVPVVYRWQSRGLLPLPIATANVWVETKGMGGSYWTTQAVYLLEEVLAMLKPIGEHQTQVRYYRITDKDTIAAVFAASKEARDKL